MWQQERLYYSWGLGILGATASHYVIEIEIAF